jgi:DUF4097 and DUF4098 domain-containing protein YvlB
VRAATLRAALVVMVLPGAACAKQTDTTVSVRPDARIQVQNFAGTISVRGWDRNAVRVVARRSRSDEVRIAGGESALSIATVARSGASAPVDYEITVPTGASLDLSGTYTAISIDGVRGPATATTVQGDVSLRGGDGIISLKSVEGVVSIRDARGRIEANGVNRGLTLRNISGDIVAETVNGSILLEAIESSDVEAVTVNGRVSYDGAIHDRGRYRFSTHNGRIIVSIPEQANAAVAAVTHEGSVSSRFAVPVSAAAGTAGVQRRATFALGTGSARVEAESFQGSITFARPGDSSFKQP